ncbi:sensor domain-containing diguanylate cyclase [Stenotrophomonas mori]|uniref:diguanylate cyclase n=1 Tax=Stenotrophomonas mori TaxID=2871096 RepID=A0ABT0SGW0_9GAMM|nr:sensor domain-containing diguanylate cyclase [Stenotrophomonas mori]MCL7714563.1 sensor domain-containing diguanylate cyclase [Stenotrophomonas mori]
MASLATLDLRKLILALTLLGALVPFANTFYASYEVQRQQLMDNTLESNYAYANKLASSTDEFIRSAQLQLSYTAQLLVGHMGDARRLGEEATRLRLMSRSFNSITIFDDTGKVLATSPETLKLQGRMLDSDAVRATLRTRQPLISQPFLSVSGNFIVLMAWPVTTPEGEFLGAIGGAIYLQRENFLDHLLGQHFYQDGSYLYVVDGNKQIIYHPDSARVGVVVLDNAAINEVAGGHSGRALVVNSKGVDMLAGYAPVPATGWGIIAQRPREATLAPLTSLMRTVLHKTLPLALATLLVLWWSARHISRPLRLLAEGARAMDRPGTAHRIQSVRSWYFESHELKKALVLGIGLLQKSIAKLREDVGTDPLTRLGNRRQLQATLQALEAAATPFAVVSLDIDHFKTVNDGHGHDAGDRVLQQLAAHMRAVARTGDVPCRVGGEEFLMVLPATTASGAAQLAERLRRQVAAVDTPPVGRITVSLGVAAWPADGTAVADVLKQADERLYAAKRAGRNRVVLEVPVTS